MGKVERWSLSQLTTIHHSSKGSCGMSLNWDFSLMCLEKQTEKPALSMKSGVHSMILQYAPNDHSQNVILMDDIMSQTAVSAPFVPFYYFEFFGTISKIDI